MTFIDIIFLNHALQSRGEKNVIGMEYEDGDNIVIAACWTI